MIEIILLATKVNFRRFSFSKKFLLKLKPLSRGDFIDFKFHQSGLMKTFQECNFITSDVVYKWTKTCEHTIFVNKCSEFQQ